MSGQVTIGRIVHYRLSAEDVSNINVQRAELTSRPRGNAVREGDVYPATVVRVNSTDSSTDSVNLQVHLDGPDTYWATSRSEHEEESGRWFWPPRVWG